MPVAQILSRVWPITTSLMLVGGYVWYRATVLAGDDAVGPFAEPGQQQGRTVLPGSKRGAFDLTTSAGPAPPQAEHREVKSYYTAPAPATSSPRATMSGSKSLVIDFPGANASSAPVAQPLPPKPPVQPEPPSVAPRTIMLGSKSGAIEVTIPQTVMPAQQQAVQQTAPQR